MKIVVEFEGEKALGTLHEIRSRVDDAEGLHEAMGEAVADDVRQHLRKTKNSPNTGWWGRVADSVTHESEATGATVSVPETGAALRLYGGTVSQKPGGPLLTIPSDKVPVRNKTRLAARDAGPLAFLAARRPARKGVVGVLVEGETYTKTRGPNAGSQGTRPKPGGSILYTLMTEVDHDPDPTVLPEDRQLAEAARDAALDYTFLSTDPHARP